MIKFYMIIISYLNFFNIIINYLFYFLIFKKKNEAWINYDRIIILLFNNMS
jgi:hypothetical protein